MNEMDIAPGDSRHVGADAAYGGKEALCAEGRMLFLSLYEPQAGKLDNATLYRRCHEMGDLIGRMGAPLQDAGRMVAPLQDSGPDGTGPATLAGARD